MDNGIVAIPENASVDQVLLNRTVNYRVELCNLMYSPPPPDADPLAVGQKHILTYGENGKPILRKSDNYAVVRTDTGNQLGTVKQHYTPFQNADLFNLMRPAVDEKRLSIQMVGLTKKGSRIFCLSKIEDDPVDIVPGDPVYRYLFLGNGHDGGIAVFGAGTNLRIACTNLMATVMREHTYSDNHFRVHHTRQVHERMRFVWDHIDLANRRFNASVELYKDLAEKNIDQDGFDEYIEAIFRKKPPKKATKTQEREFKHAEAQRIENVQNEIGVLFEQGRGTEVPGVKGTWWGAFNSVTEYLNYERRGSQASRFEGLMFGGSNSLAFKAVREAKELAFN